RSLFFESELYHRLNRTDGLTAGPILGNTEVVWRDEARANEDAVHAVINAACLLDEDWYALEAMATTNRTGGTFATTNGQDRNLKEANSCWKAQRRSWDILGRPRGLGQVTRSTAKRAGR
ncbi:MAG: hypothetical protein ACE5LS_06765, partial [Thermoplasmata archaeon]